MNTQRKMLYISTHPQGDDFVVRFELENYYRRRDRRVVAEQELTTFDPQILVKDELFYQRMIGYTVRGIEIEIEDINEGKRYPCQILYPFFREGKDVLRKDREDYVPKRHRKFCKEIIVKSNEYQKLGENINFQAQLARIICQFLPLGPFPHELDETAPKVRIELDSKIPLFYDGWCDE